MSWLFGKKAAEGPLAFVSPAKTVRQSGRAVVVYTMGKVASSSLQQAIQDAGLPVHAIHTLNDGDLLRTAGEHVARSEFPPRHICVALAWKRGLFVHPSRCYYISLVREPVARNISAFFQNFHKFTTLTNPVEPERAEEIFERFMRDYPHQGPIEWFDREFRDELGIDIFAEPFDLERKMRVDSRYALFRIDVPDEVKAEALSPVLGTKITIGRVNDAEDKEYRALYNRVRQVARFTPKFLDSLYDTKFARHFWSEDELNAFKAFWLDPNRFAGR